MTKASAKPAKRDPKAPREGKKIAKPRPAGQAKPQAANGSAPENPQVERMRTRNDQRDSLRKYYTRILEDIKSKDKSGMKAATDFLNFLKKNSQEATRKLLGIKCIVLVLKYGKPDQREAAVLTLMTSDLSVLVPLRSGAFLFSEIWKYCAKAKGIGLLNSYFENNFASNAKKISCYQSLSAYLHSLPAKRQGELLLQHKASFQYEGHHLKELLESYQKLKKQFEASVHQYAMLVNFE